MIQSTPSKVFPSFRDCGMFIVCLLLFSSELSSTPVDYEESSTLENTDSKIVNSTDNSTSDLYVIRAVVYEIGVLTDADNSTNNSSERHEEVNISFFDPPHLDNGSLVLDIMPTVSVNNQSLEKTENVNDNDNS